MGKKQTSPYACFVQTDALYVVAGGQQLVDDAVLHVDLIGQVDRLEVQRLEQLRDLPDQRREVSELQIDTGYEAGVVEHRDALVLTKDVEQRRERVD